MLAAAADGAGARDQLDARGWVAHLSDDPLPALAELCLLERLDATRRAWGRPPDGLALVVVAPSRWPELPALLSAARRYVPAARLWAFENGTLTPLSAPAASDNGEGAPGDGQAANAAAPGSYEMRTPPQAADEDRTSQITGDEISMLLDGDFRDEQHPETGADDQDPKPPERRDTGDKPATDPEA